MGETRGKRLLLHACCGPCTIMPLRLLAAEGFETTVFYFNPNIQPEAEYARRLETLGRYLSQLGVPLVEGSYDAQLWRRQAGCHGGDRPERCRACYRLRLAESARVAAERGYDGLATTLAVSPYQLTQAIDEELVRAAHDAGVEPVARDFRPYYPEATRESRELGMYRQNYCGCLISKEEAAEERAWRKREHREKVARRAAEREREQAPERAARKAERERYDQLQRRKRQVRDELRRQRRESERKGASGHDGDVARPGVGAIDDRKGA